MLLVSGVNGFRDCLLIKGWGGSNQLNCEHLFLSRVKCFLTLSEGGQLFLLLLGGQNLLDPSWVGVQMFLTTTHGYLLPSTL